MGKVALKLLLLKKKKKGDLQWFFSSIASSDFFGGLLVIDMSTKFHVAKGNWFWGLNLKANY